MTLRFLVGRRVPKNWFKRQAAKAAGLLSFQENLWIMINQSMNLGKKKCNISGRGEWVQTKKMESESLHYNIEWLCINVKGDKEFEKEEYEDTMDIYKQFGKLFKKEMPKDKELGRFFKTKVLSEEKVKEAYEKGYGSVSDNNIANKLLEMGILTHVEWIQDFDAREVEIKPDF